jgi:hypothetical protein
MPLVIILFVAYYEHYKETRIWQIKFLHIVIAVTPILFFLGTPAYPLVRATGFVDFAWAKAIILMLMLIPVIYLVLKKKNFKLELLVLSLLIARIGFNAFILPSRVHDHFDTAAKRRTFEISSNTADKPLYRYDILIPYPNLFYATAERHDIIHRKKDLNDPGYYLAKDVSPEYHTHVIDSIRFRSDTVIFLINIE